MIIKDLIAFWKGKDFSTQALASFGEILKISEQMFKKTIAELFEPSGDQNLKQEVYNMDQRINELERGIRRRIIEHMATAPGDERNVSLILMSVGKDAERIGDYAKNIRDIARFHPSAEGRAYHGKLTALSKDISKLLEDTRRLYEEQDT